MPSISTSSSFLACRRTTNAAAQCGAVKKLPLVKHRSLSLDAKTQRFRIWICRPEWTKALMVLQVSHRRGKLELEEKGVYLYFDMEVRKVTSENTQLLNQTKSPTPEGKFDTSVCSGDCTCWPSCGLDSHFVTLLSPDRENGTICSCWIPL